MLFRSSASPGPVIISTNAEHTSIQALSPAVCAAATAFSAFARRSTKSGAAAAASGAGAASCANAVAASNIPSKAGITHLPKKEILNVLLVALLFTRTSGTGGVFAAREESRESTPSRHRRDRALACKTNVTAWEGGKAKS